MAAITASVTTVEAQSLLLPLRVRGSADELLGIVELYAEWRDPLSERIREWALGALESVATDYLQSRLSVLDDQILINPLDRRGLREIPYLIDGETVLPESVFDDLYHTANFVTSGHPRSPFNGRPLESRQKVHEFALKILRWRGVACEAAPEVRAVPMQNPFMARLKLQMFETLAAGAKRLQRSEDDEKGCLSSAAHLAQRAQEVQQQQSHAVTQMIEQLREQHRAFHRRLDEMEGRHRARMRELQEEVEKMRDEVRGLQAQVAAADAVNQQHRAQIALLEFEILAKEAEIARIRAQIDDDTCVIL